MDEYERALQKLKADHKTLRELERKTGVPEETLRDIKSGKTRFPRLDTLRTLSDYYCKAT